MAEAKKDTEGKPDDKLQTTTPIRLWTVAKYLKINYNNKIIEATHCDGWYSVGFDHVIQQKEKIILDVVPLSPRVSNNVLYFSVGFATKGVINTNAHNQIGMYLNGWNYHCNGYIYCDAKQRSFSCPVALQQKLRMEMEQYKIKIFVENKEIKEFDVSETFKNNKNKQFYPCLSINGNGCSVQIVNFTIQ